MAYDQTNAYGNLSYNQRKKNTTRSRLPAIALGT